MATVATAKPKAPPESERARAPPESAARAPAISRKALAEPGRSSLLAPSLQLKGLVSSPDDDAELEADRIAEHVVSMPDPAPRAQASVTAPLQRVAARRRPRRGRAVPRPRVPAPAAAGSPAAAPVMQAVSAAASAGSPLSRRTRAYLEPRFGADFSGVKVHTGPPAKQLSGELGARAFTYGRDIFFNEGEYRPDSREGKKLLAHELTHTIQQRGAIQRKALVQQRTLPHLQRGLLGDIGDALGDAADAVGEFVGDVVQIVKDFVADKADIIPGFRLLCLILGQNPINDAPAPGGGRAILQELTTFIPFGDKVLEALTNHGIIDKGGAFIDEQLAAFKRLVSSVTGALGTFFSSLGPGDALDPGGAWDRAKSIFTTPLNNLKSFASGLVSGFVTLVREVIIKPLGKWAAANIPKWDLLMAVLGQNPISEEGESPASQIIGAFMNLIGQGEIWENIKRGKAVDRAWAWFQNALKGAKSLVAQLPGLIVSTIKSLTIMDVLTIVGAFQKIVGAFGSFASSFFTWAGTTVLDLLEIILSVVAPGAVPYLKKAGGAFSTIIRNPIGFVRTLVAAGKAGFQNFAGNFLTHLKAALIGWLTGSLAGAGVYIPQGFTVLELLKFVLSVLGLTWANIRGKLVAATNETTVKALETGFAIVKTLVTEGPAAAWQEIVKTLTNLKQMAIDAVMDFVKSKIVEVAVNKLLSMLSPAGAFIQALIAIYNTIMFFVERIRQIAAVAASFIDSIAAIASGNIGPAAARVEKTLAGLLVLVISFLARLAGLGKVSDAVLGLVKKVRDPIDKALNAVVAWIVAQAKKLGKLIAGAADRAISGGPKSPEETKAIVERAQRELPGKIDSLLAGEPSKLKLRAQLLIWRAQYKLSSLELKEAGEEGSFSATVNPTFALGGGVSIYIGDSQLLGIVCEEADKAMKSHPKVRSEAARITQESAALQGAPAGGTPQTLNVRGTAAMVGAASAVMHPVSPPTGVSALPPVADMQVGVDAAGNPIIVSSVRRNPNSEANRVIRGSAGGTGSMATYDTHRKEVGRPSATGIRALQGLGAGEQLAIMDAKANRAGEFFATMVGQESLRRPENLAFSAMTTQMMTEGDVTFAQGVNMHPATRKSVKGEPTTGAGQRELAQAVAAGGPLAGSDVMKDLRQRSVDLVTAWIRSRLRAGEGPITKSKQALLIWVRKAVRKRIDDYLTKGS